LKGVAGLVLAAGASTRLGTGAPKQLLPLGQATLLDRILAESLQSELDVVVLVLGFKMQDILKGLKTSLQHPKLKVVENRSYALGMSTSVSAGLSAVEKECDYVMILLGDMPHVTSSLINLLLRRCRRAGLPLAALTSGGRRSHPVMIGRLFYPSLHQLQGDEGARSLFAEHADQVCLVETEEHYDDGDIDTWDDYVSLKEKLE
jgi:molybdenum cofactor cytidylyltransferase